MKRYILHTPFNIYQFEAQTWKHSVHKHTYFEIIFILKGKGVHHINGNGYQYAEGDVFLLGPEDFHEFAIAELTTFCFIRFNESFYAETKSDAKNGWQPIVETLLYTASQSRGSLVQEAQEKQQLHRLLKVLTLEYEQQTTPYFEQIRDNLMRSIMLILARNLLAQSPPKASDNDASIEGILMYIKQHIYQPDKLSIDHLAEVFHYAPAYISIFFKKHTGESLKQYITKHRIKLIEARLLYSQHTLTEIADEFGFTDESHLCKQFRKYTGLTPTVFRKQA